MSESEAVERNARMNEEALRRAVARNQDGEPYSAAEYAPAVPQPDAALSWGGGQPAMYPSAAPAATIPGQPTLTSTPRVDSGASGVDAIVNWGGK